MNPYEQGLADNMVGQGTDANFNAAVAELGLNKEEQALYQRHLTNLWGKGGVDNPDGSRSSLYQMSMEHNGRFYNVPTVWEGKILDPKVAGQRALKEGIEKFPSYDSEDEAEARYGAMHDYMEKDTGDYFKARR